MLSSTLGLSIHKIDCYEIGNTFFVVLPKSTLDVEQTHLWLLKPN
jgi:hypothetical protein